MESGQLANLALSGYCSRNDSVLISITALTVMTDTGTRWHNSPRLNIRSEIYEKKRAREREDCGTKKQRKNKGQVLQHLGRKRINALPDAHISSYLGGLKLWTARDTNPMQRPNTYQNRNSLPF